MIEKLKTEKSVLALALPVKGDRAYYWADDPRGFGVVVSKSGTRTFVVRKRVGGTLVKRTIGAMGTPRSDGHVWTLMLARREALLMLGNMAVGTMPVKRAVAHGPTLQDALEMHVRAMRNDGCSERSIDTIESEIPRLLADWLERPIVELKRSNLREIHDRLVDEGKPALARRIKAQVSAVWNTLDGASDDGLDATNPASGWRAAKYIPSRKRVDARELPEWHAKVMAMENHVRRDLQLFCLFTGMRSEAARHVRWEHIDEKAGRLIVPKPKGGEARAFELPLPKTIVDLLPARKRENRDIFGPFGGDDGWVFASLTRAAPFEVQPIVEAKEYRQTGGREGEKVRYLPGLHTLRRTYLSVAQEAGVSELDRSVLANHAYGRQSVNATYIAQAFEHLAECQAKIEAGLWARIKPTPTEKRRGKLKAV